MENKKYTPPDDSRVDPEEYLAPGSDADQKKMMIGIIVGGVLIIMLTIAFIWFLFTAPAITTAKIRDIFIIFLALQSLLIGVVLILLIVQVARLTNLLQNEIKPILDSTNETVSNLRGTVSFLSDNMVEPIIKVSEYSAGAREFFKTIGFVRKSTKSSGGREQ